MTPKPPPSDSDSSVNEPVNPTEQALAQLLREHLPEPLAVRCLALRRMLSSAVWTDFMDELVSTVRAIQTPLILIAALDQAPPGLALLSDAIVLAQRGLAKLPRQTFAITEEDGPAKPGEPSVGDLVQFIPIAQGLHAKLKATLPAGVDFGLFILPPPTPSHPDSTALIALTEASSAFRRAIGEWFLAQMPHGGFRR